jgi:hypothetical protein
VTHTRTKLERRARALLRVYPAEYRRDRAEEIIATLLEAAPAGRSFPSARDTWSLLAAGRHARAARNRSLGAKANLRLALLLGASIFLSSRIDFAHGAQWPWIAGGALTTAATLAPWLGSRTATTVLVIPAGALVAYPLLTQYPLSGDAMVNLAVPLIALGVLVALSGGPSRLPRSWSWLPCVIPAASTAWALGSFPVESLYEGALLLLAVVVVCWLVTDGRPAFGFCAALLLEDLLLSLSQLTFVVRTGSLGLDLGPLMFFLVLLAIIAPILLPAAWLLRRQAPPSPRPLPNRNG